VTLIIRIRDWLLAPIARQLAERNGLIDHRNYLLSAHLTDDQWIRVLKRKRLLVKL
jgi:hypothetical protein